MSIQIKIPVGILRLATACFRRGGGPARPVSRFLGALLLGGTLMLGSGCAADPDPAKGQVKDAVVVGGGIAGLTAAYQLKDQDVLLLEREAAPGGRALSGNHNGTVYAKGTEYLGELEEPLARMAKDVGLAPIEIPAPMDAKIQDGKMHVGEDSIARMIIDRAGLAEYNRFVATVQKASDRIESAAPGDAEVRRLDNLSTLDWFKENRFPPVFSDHYNVSCRGLFGASLAESSALCMIPEIGFDYTHAASLTQAPAAQEGEDSTDAFTFKGGISSLCEGVARKLGDRVRTGCTVTQVKRMSTDAGEGFLVSYIDAAGQVQRVAARTVILAVPAPVALKLGAEALTEEQKALMAGAEYAPYMTVALFSSKAIFEDAFDLAVPDGMFFTDLYPGGWAERGLGSPAGGHVLSAYVAPRSFRDKLLALSDAEVVRNVFSDLDRLFPGASGKVEGWEVQRFPYGYPVMTPGAYGRMKQLSDLEGNGVYLAGDYLTNPTFDGAAESGATAAEKCSKRLEAMGR